MDTYVVKYSKVCNILRFFVQSNFLSVESFENVFNLFGWKHGGGRTLQDLLFFFFFLTYNLFLS